MKNTLFNLALKLFILLVMLSLATDDRMPFIEVPQMEKKAVVLSRREEIKRYLDVHLQYPEEVYQIILYETGHLSSYSYQTDCNLFGMQCPVRRPATTYGCRENKHGQFATYRTWKESVDDFKLWLCWNLQRHPLAKDDNFFLWIKERGWNSVNPDYFNVIKKVKEQAGRS